MRDNKVNELLSQISNNMNGGKIFSVEMGKWRGQEEEAGTPRSWDLPKVELFI